MIGRNVFSLFLQVKGVFDEEKKKELQEAKHSLFVFTALILTGILGLVSGIGLLLPNQIFGYYLFFVVSGMMIYSYLNYAGITYEQKNWLMFILCLTVILTVSTLASLLGYYMATS
jgi:hypothetical protein